MKMISPDDPDARELVQRLSRAALLVDKALAGPPPLQAQRVNYDARQKQSELAALLELRELRNTLVGMTLD